MYAMMTKFDDGLADPPAALPENAPRCRVLLAEDDPANQMVAVHLLEMLDFEVHAVTDGLEALKCCQSGLFDIAVLDVKMQHMDGLEAIRHLRAFESDAGRAPMPIICVTANAFIDQEALCKAAGASDYLAKPYGIHAFQSKLTALRQRWLQARTV